MQTDRRDCSSQKKLGHNSSLYISRALEVDMTQYVKKMLEEFPQKSKPNFSRAKKFKVNKTPAKMPQNKTKIFHTFVMKKNFLQACFLKSIA